MFRVGIFGTGCIDDVVEWSQKAENCNDSGGDGKRRCYGSKESS